MIGRRLTQMAGIIRRNRNVCFAGHIGTRSIGLMTSRNGPDGTPASILQAAAVAHILLCRTAVMTDNYPGTRRNLETKLRPGSCSVDHIVSHYFMKKDIFKGKADSLTPQQRKRYHTVSECDREVKTKGHLLDFMEDVTETKVYPDGSGGNWSVFSRFCPDGWRHSSSMGIGPSVWETRSWPLVVNHLEGLTGGSKRHILSNLASEWRLPAGTDSTSSKPPCG